MATAGYDIGLLLRLAHRRAARAFADALRPLGVEYRHFSVLLQLRRGGPASQRELIDALGSDKSSMVRTVDDLEQLGLCRRRPAAGDRRAYAVELTPDGRELLAKAEATAAGVSSHLLAHLPAADRRALRDLLARFVAPEPDGADEPDAGPPAGPPTRPPPEPAPAPPRRVRRAKPTLADLPQPGAEPDAHPAARRHRIER